jgi:LysM domain
LSSLTAHLLEPGDHGRLPFHASCPVCRRERLSGTLSSEPVVSRRTQAVLAGGVLAFSASAPGLAAAAVPDSQAEGVAAPEAPPGAELDDPEFDPGGETALPFETAPALTEPAEDDGAGAPIDAEPIDDVEGRLAPLAAGDGNETEEPAAPLAEPAPPATGDGTSGVTDAAPPETAVPQAPNVVAAPESTSQPPLPETDRQRSMDRPAKDRRQRRPAEDHSAESDTPGAPAPVGPAPVAPAPVAPAPVAPTPVSPPSPEVPLAAPVADTATVQAAARSNEDPSLRDARRYVVQPGDSLWSIAKRLLASEASLADIAREVNRLWTLNEDRIGTGDPDLLMVGTKLRLR